MPGVTPAQLGNGGSAAARTLAGSDPMIRCSRLDLFHTGLISTPRAGRQHARLQLRDGLLRKTVPDSE